MGVMTSSTLSAPSALLAHPLVKVRPTAAWQPSWALGTMSAAVNEYESFQVVVFAANEYGANVAGITVTPPPGTNITSLVHREHHINITTVSDCDGAIGLWPDALIPDIDPFVSERRNAFPALVPAGRMQAFWVDLFVPPGTPPAAAYEVRVHVDLAPQASSAAAAPHAVLPLPPVSLRVRNFSLPSTSRRYTTVFGCNIRSALLAVYEGPPPSNISAEEKRLLMRRYTELGLMHRATFPDFLLADDDVVVSPLLPNGSFAPTPWPAVQARWGDFLATEDTDGAVLPFGLRGARATSVNLPALHYGARDPGEVNHTLIDATWHATGCSAATPQWGYAYWGAQPDLGANDMLQYCEHSLRNESDPWSKTCGTLWNGTCTLQHPTLPPADNAAVTAYWRAAASHARVHGWLSRAFDYTCDEPGATPSKFAVCEVRAAALHSADPALRSLITAEVGDPRLAHGNLSAQIDVWVPLINYVDSSNSSCPWYPPWAKGDQRPAYNTVVTEGKTLLSYQSCMSDSCTAGCHSSDTCEGGGTWPSYMIDVKATFNRVMSWANYKYDIGGELYWGVNAADAIYFNGSAPGGSSWQQQLVAGGNGDGSLTYPGRPGEIGGASFVPVASLRLKHVRDGLEDLEYMYALEAQVGRDAALAIVGEIVRTPYDFEHEALPMLSARDELADRIEKALAGR